MYLCCFEWIGHFVMNITVFTTCGLTNLDKRIVLCGPFRFVLERRWWARACASQSVSCLALQTEVVQAGQFPHNDLNQSWFPHWRSAIQHQMCFHCPHSGDTVCGCPSSLAFVRAKWPGKCKHCKWLKMSTMQRLHLPVRYTDTMVTIKVPDWEFEGCVKSLLEIVGHGVNRECKVWMYKHG